MEKKTFQVAVTWSMFGVMKIEAETLQEAEMIALSTTELPDEEDQEYNGYFEIAKESENHGIVLDEEEN